MDVAVMGHTAFLTEERSIYHDLVVGLIDEQVRVVQVLPEEGAERLSAGFGRVATWPESRWSAVDRLRLSKLAGAMRGEPVDVVHALGGATWPAALAWAERLETPAVLSSWSAADAEAAGRIGRRADPGRCAFTAATEPLRREIALRLDPAFLVALTPPGVHLAEPAPMAEPGRAPCLVVTGDGQLDAYVGRLFEGLRLVVDDAPDTQVFVDTMGGDGRALWRHAERTGLLGHLSFVPPGGGPREMLLRGDVFIQPQPLRRARGLLLQAMAHGRPILAQRDELIDYFIDGETVAVVDLPDADAWARRLNDWAQHPAARAELGASARAWVGERRVASRFVERVTEVYRRVTQASLPFAEAKAS